MLSGNMRGYVDEDFSTKNENFIVESAGLSKYRTLRVFILRMESNNDQNQVYDIIIPKVPKLTVAAKKKEAIKQLKASLGALSQNEVGEINDELSREMQFMRNPFCYYEITDLLNDINFKHYMNNNYNLLLQRDGHLINTFLDIKEKDSYIFAAEIKDTLDRTIVRKQIKNVNQELDFLKNYNMGKNIVNKKTVSLQLENFSETEEFFEGMDPKLKYKCRVSPLKKSLPEHRVDVEENLGLTESLFKGARSTKKIKFAKSLNTNPIRKSVPSILPPLPQRLLLNRANFKLPKFRSLFFDHYCYPVLEEELYHKMETVYSESDTSEKLSEQLLGAPTISRKEDLSASISGLVSKSQLQILSESQSHILFNRSDTLSKSLTVSPMQRLSLKKGKRILDKDKDKSINLRDELLVRPKHGIKGEKRGRETHGYTYGNTSKFFALFYNSDRFKEKLEELKKGKKASHPAGIGRMQTLELGGLKSHTEIHKSPHEFEDLSGALQNTKLTKSLGIHSRANSNTISARKTGPAGKKNGGKVPKGRNENVPSYAMPRNSSVPEIHKRFSLDYEVIQKIKEGYRLNSVSTVGQIVQQKKNKVKSFAQKQEEKYKEIAKVGEDASVQGEIELNQKHIQASTTLQLIKKFRKSQVYKSLLNKFNFGFEKYEKIIRQFFFIYKVSLFLKNYQGEEFGLEDSSTSFGKKFMGFSMRVMKEMKLNESEYLEYLEVFDPTVFKVELSVVKVFFKMLRKKSVPIFNRLMLALDINTKRQKAIGIEKFFIIRYYLIDQLPSHFEAVLFASKFLMPNRQQAPTISELIRLFSFLLNEDEENPNSELIIKALISNFILCGIIDDEGTFQMSKFQVIYKSSKMNIKDLLAIILR